MHTIVLPESTAAPPRTAEDYWFNDACILDMDYFVKTLSGIKAKGVRPDLIGSLISHYAPKWLPDLHSPSSSSSPTSSSSAGRRIMAGAESLTAAWMKKRFFVETLVGILPHENDAVPCNFLLRLLRVANSAGADTTYRAELEKRVAWQLDQATLKDLLIPSFNHTCGTLLDVELVGRLVKRFASTEEKIGGGARGGAAVAKVARLVDAYLAEAAVDANLTLAKFIELVGALPAHARATDDGLYRAIDTYLKAHPEVTKQERKLVFHLIDCRKLSPEASHHASQNERLPVRALLQVLIFEQSRVSRQLEWSGQLLCRSPNPSGLDLPGRSQSKREVVVQYAEIRKLKEDVVRLQDQCNALQGKLDKVAPMEKRGGSGFLRWKKIIKNFNNNTNNYEGFLEKEGYGRQTPMNNTKTNKGRTPSRWRRSMS